jgi:hypothetical protein
METLRSQNQDTSSVGVYDPTVHCGVPHVVLLGRTTSLIATRWYVRKHIRTQESYTGSGRLNNTLCHVGVEY